MNIKYKIFPMRIAKRISASGYCSRRQAEKYIKLEKVFVNNKIVTSPAMQINKNDKILVNGEIINSIPKIKLYMFHKPKGCIVSEKDNLNRKTIYDIISKLDKRLMYIGRLDYNSEGLLLLTNNGSLKRYFELPENNIERKYKVKVYGDINKLNKRQLSKGVSINGIFYGNINVKIIKNNLKTSWIEVKLNEGKNREIRKIINYYGLKVNDLIRTDFGPYNIGNLEKTKIIECKISSKILRKANID